MKEYLTTRATAHLIDRSPSMVRLMVRLGTIKVAAKTESGVSLFSRREMERLAGKLRAKRQRAPGGAHGAR